MCGLSTKPQQISPSIRQPPSRQPLTLILWHLSLSNIRQWNPNNHQHYWFVSKLHFEEIRHTLCALLECDFWCYARLCNRTRPDPNNCLHMYASMHSHSLFLTMHAAHIHVSQLGSMCTTQGGGAGIKGQSACKREQTSFIPSCLGTRLWGVHFKLTTCVLSHQRTHNHGSTHRVPTNTDKHEHIILPDGEFNYHSFCST